MIVLVATTNPGKLKEITRILAGVPVELETLAAFPHIPVAEETGRTFAENARQKARYYSTATGLLTMAEDSGFEVDALNREPGVHSARYLGEQATYAERFAHLHERMRAAGAADRRARFVCALALSLGERILFEHEAAVEGELADSPLGDRGFGYDPIFRYPPLGRTFGELSDDEKNRVSHRGQVMRAFRDYLLHSGPHGPDRHQQLLDR